MSASLRKVLFWLVILAIPLHGIAGAGSMPRHQVGHAAMQMEAVGSAAAAGVMETAATMKQAMTGCADPASDCDHAQSKGIVKCNLSAPCGLVAATSSHSAVSLDRSLSAAPIAVPSHDRIAFCTGAPERPPRFSA